MSRLMVTNKLSGGVEPLYNGKVLVDSMYIIPKMLEQGRSWGRFSLRSIPGTQNHLVVRAKKLIRFP